jgi:hypothetical protein
MYSKLPKKVKGCTIPILADRENGNVEPRNEPEMGTEVCMWKMILGWAQIIERRLCEKVVWPIGVLQ